MMYNHSGVCEYCGQTKFYQAPIEEVNAAEADDYVTKHCSCDGARKAREMDSVDKSIRALMGDECIKQGFDYSIGEATRMATRAIAEAIYDKYVNNAAFVEPQGDTIKLNRKDGGVRITRICKKQVSM